MKKKQWIAIAGVVLLLLAMLPWGNMYIKSLNAAKDAAQSQALRESAFEEIKDLSRDSKEAAIKYRLVKAWNDWQPDYEGWLSWSDSLYTQDSVIEAIGGEQTFADYQASMKLQREKSTMAMGPITDYTLEGNTAIIHYHMYLTSDGMFGKTTQDIVVTEHNTFEMINGEWMVTHLVLTTQKA
ncbi:hypothetical protein [Intestinimonas butyriciproducens]|uniref:SnoaL-like domain-containing protein n=1 Tax=Intestinimonas butyriciproducens TaxID=1297617 RepID=A0A0S2W1D4_9FIRM|nr:hypothetical protein [Intestinimonas butyriciproducens]ALP93176.1 hypothetical protein IB211_00782c [Intestinimonas butyriciproducens]